MILRLLLIVLSVFYSSYQDFISKPENCALRCVAQCVDLGRQETEYNFEVTKKSCLSKCQTFRDKNDLCSDNLCWSTCNNAFAIDVILPAPSELSLSDVREVSWSPVHGADLYAVAVRSSTSKNFQFDDLMIVENQNVDLGFSTKHQCSELEVTVLAFSKDGVGKDSKELTVSKPKPTANPKLELLDMEYFNTTLINDFYQANATVFVQFRYHADYWFLGEDDLDVQPLFHLISCVDPDLSQGIPVPEFSLHTKNTTISTEIGSDMMDRKCRYVYYLQSISSKTCGTMTEMPSPPSSALQTVQVDCDIVKNAPCFKTPSYPHPQCGQVENVKWEVLEVQTMDPSLDNLTVNVTFNPIVRNNDIPTLYFVGIFGEAVKYDTKEEEAFLGVNITKELGNSSSCEKFDDSRTCVMENFNRSIIISGLHSNKLYGLTICAIKDQRNSTLPNLTEVSKSAKPKAIEIFIPEHESSNATGIIVGVSVSAILLASISLIVIYILYRKRAKRRRIFEKLEISQRKMENRYTEFPSQLAKNDIWEIERRNLIIHNDKKLGSGAFGTVYLGKLIGKSMAHKDANSTLGINMMRAENCQVAVKMLPEYADSMSKHEFLREIALMKTLGYHERLVNMLACITETEPLCLIVEYCDDGDLLQFLRERCKYMMKLDDLSISYHDPPLNENYDAAMIITLKQLLQFAVQVSYGLEYLSQKGFVHRDVAARNVLVHEGSYCKIGDFGLCRYIYADQAQYRSKGGKLPLKWMSPEAIRRYEFTIKSDVWSFGVLLFEIITLGGSPYPAMPPEDVLPYLESGGRIEQPDNCPDDFYEIMLQCWCTDPDDRIEFPDVRMKLASQLEEITEDYSYLKLDAAKDYYNVNQNDQKVTAETKCDVVCEVVQE